MTLSILKYVKRVFTDGKRERVWIDDTNKWENQFEAITNFLKRYSWSPETEIKKGAVIYCPYGLNERLIAQNNGTTGSVEPTWDSYKESGQIEDGSVIWKIELPFVKQETNVAIGTILQQPWTSAPPGFKALHDGPLLNRSDYPKLWDFVQKYCAIVTEVEWQKRAATDESVGVFSLGDGETTFRCPKMLSFTRGGNPQNSGKYYKDQNKSHNHTGTISKTTNLTGYFGADDRMVTSGIGGVFTAKSGYPSGSERSETGYRIAMDANHTHNITTNDNGASEAYPKHIVWPYYIRVDDL